MQGLFFVTGLILGFGWGIVVARGFLTLLGNVVGAIEAGSHF